MESSSKFLYVFNKLFSSFIKTLKEVGDELKPVIKKHYKVIDKSSSQYFEHFWNSVEPKWKDLVECENVREVDHLKDVEVAIELNLDSIFNSVKEEDKETITSHIYLLLIFAYLYAEISKETSPVQEDATQEENSSHVLFNNVVALLSLIQNNKRDSDAYKELIDSIVDDDIVKLLSKVSTVSGAVPKQFEASSSATANPLEFLQGLENSKIASLAKEITSEIDLSNLSIDKPEDISKLMDMSDGNNFLGNIVSKVSNKLTEKLNTGELKQEDLMNEAMSVMGALNNGDGLGGLLKNMGGLGGLGDLMSNPMMAEMMKMAKKGKVQTKNTNGSRKSSGMSTRDRLKKKLDEKRRAQEKSQP
jgi:hypothetical protein